MFMVNWVDHIDGEVEGTPVNRKNLMAMQGFESVKTTFGSGTITETNEQGEKMVTSFGGGNIVEYFTGANGITITKTTTFNADGSISEVLSE